MTLKYIIRRTTEVNEANTTSTDSLVGWTPESPGRGTWSIMTSCLFTIFICTWTAIHPRIHISHKLSRLHKLAQLTKAILAPEMVCLESLQEWVQARKMVKRSADATGGGLKMVHAFYIGMLGIRYETEFGSRVLWPSQYAWLLNNKLVEWADSESWGLSEQSIRDKNKADGVIKLSALCQVIWFVLVCITRAALNFSISPLESMTLAYVFVVIITYMFWWLKPKDIATVDFVTLPEMTAEQRRIFDSLAMEDNYDIDDRLPPKPKSIAWYLVGRDCKDDEVLVMGQTQSQEDITSFRRKRSRETASSAESFSSNRSIISSRSYDFTVTAPEVDSSSVASEKAATQESKVITEWDDALYMSKAWPLICITGAAFGAFHLISWNTTFPTNAECWLWRASALLSVITSILCMQFKSVTLGWDGPLTILRTGSPIVYLVARVFMMVEVFAALRAMPASTYDTYAISNYFLRFS